MHVEQFSHYVGRRQERETGCVISKNTLLLILMIIAFSIAATLMSFSIFGIVKALRVPYGSASYPYWRLVGRLSGLGLGASAIITIPLGISLAVVILRKISSCYQSTTQ